MGLIETILIGTVPLVVGTLVTFFTTRKKYRAETATVQTQNSELSFEIYRKLLDDVNIRVQTLTDELRKKEEHFIERTTDYRIKIKDGEIEILKARERISILEEKVSYLSDVICLVSDCTKRIPPKKNKTKN